MFEVDVGDLDSCELGATEAALDEETGTSGIGGALMFAIGDCSISVSLTHQSKNTRNAMSRLLTVAGARLAARSARNCRL